MSGCDIWLTVLYKTQIILTPLKMGEIFLIYSPYHLPSAIPGVKPVHVFMATFFNLSSTLLRILQRRILMCRVTVRSGNTLTI
jgi:hypothetical protein